MTYKYKGRTDYWRELITLGNTPRNSKEAYNKMACLMELREKCEPGYDEYNDLFRHIHFSKRYNRINKMYWAFRHMEAGA